MSDIFPKKMLKFGCIRCGRCCSDRSTFVNLSVPDIIRMKRSGGFSVKELQSYVGFYILEDFESTRNGNKNKSENKQSDDFSSLTDKMVFCPFASEKTPFYPGIKKDRFGKCVFLKASENNCEIYPYRPMICRSFPFTINYGIINHIIGYLLSVRYEFGRTAQSKKRFGKNIYYRPPSSRVYGVTRPGGKANGRIRTFKKGMWLGVGFSDKIVWIIFKSGYDIGDLPTDGKRNICSDGNKTIVVGNPPPAEPPDTGKIVKGIAESIENRIIYSEKAYNYCPGIRLNVMVSRRKAAEIIARIIMDRILDEIVRTEWNLHVKNDPKKFNSHTFLKFITSLKFYGL